ncbi:sodium channel protein Nach [Musca domestica]|uniref:Sodium channel protein Nach n=2 Tax=Musca domestica TaxID=7370 RepID=A0A9J7CMK2_MUSDO|nr:sodium channel protein Nach [Musca domestica]
MSWKEKLKIVPKIVFYITFVGIAMPMYLNISTGLLNNFQTTKISFNLDTLFLNWNTSFPAVTICELYNGEKIWDLSEKYFGVDHDLRLDDVVGEIVYFQGSCTSCDACDNQNITCPRNFTRLLSMFRSNCSELIGNCKYNNNFIECCDHFQPLRTEYGLCFAFNSNQANKIAETQYINNREVGAGFLTFEVTADIQLFLHSPFEIPFLTAEGMIRETVLQGLNKEVVINAMEVYNHPSLDNIDMEERKCRFFSELTELGRHLKLYSFYSFSTCVVECAFSIHLKFCNCSNHFLAKEGSPHYHMCDYEGLMCLTDYYYDILEERRQCDCMSPCEEPEYNIIFNSAEENKKKKTDFTKIRVGLAELPTLRYVRKVSKSNLDLLISLGGLAGLFFNVSLIRIVEVVFLLWDFKWRAIRNLLK